jgi:hypothetical protein
MVLGILGLFLCWFPFVGWVCALLGVIFGAIGMARAKRVRRGGGMALAGLLCGGLGIVAGVGLWLLFMRAVGGAIEDSKNAIVKLQVHRLEEQYIRWQIQSGQNCPDSLLDVARADDRHASEFGLRDPWSQPYRFVCGPSAPHGGFGVYSIGPDGVDNHGEPGSDDIASWR